MPGLIHIYCGDGKGKTTASVGLAVRAAGAGKKVLFVQFFKNGTSSELKVLREHMEVLFCETQYGFFKNMDADTRERAGKDYSALLETALAKAGEDLGLLVLDEAISACNHRMISEERVLDFLKNKPEQLEVVLTGRDPSAALLEAADYVTEMRKQKHPFDTGIKARKGIEY